MVKRNISVRTAQKRVKRGAEFLASKGYDISRVNLNTFTFNDCFHCVIGQLIDNDFPKAIRNLGLDFTYGVDEDVHYGFGIVEPSDGAITEKIWRRRIEKAKKNALHV